MKKVIILSIIIMISFVCFAQKAILHSKHKTEQSAKNEAYTCKMHQNVMSDKPGKCPVCGMNLEKQKMTDEQKKLWKEGTYVKPKE